MLRFHWELQISAIVFQVLVSSVSSEQFDRSQTKFDQGWFEHQVKKARIMMLEKGDGYVE